MIQFITSFIHSSLVVANPRDMFLSRVRRASRAASGAIASTSSADVAIARRHAAMTTPWRMPWMTTTPSMTRAYASSSSPRAGANKGPVGWVSLLLVSLTGGGCLYAYDLERARRVNAAREGRRRGDNGFQTRVAGGRASVGGDFTLVDAKTGKRFDTAKDLRGRFALLYFGFTHCPDVCPDELEKVAEVVDAVNEARGSSVNALVPVFITIDPHRDDKKRVKAYVEEFHPTMIGLVGSERRATTRRESIASIIVKPATSARRKIISSTTPSSPTSSIQTAISSRFTVKIPPPRRFRGAFEHAQTSTRVAASPRARRTIEDRHKTRPRVHRCSIHASRAHPSTHTHLSTRPFVHARVSPPSPSVSRGAGGAHRPSSLLAARPRPRETRRARRDRDAIETRSIVRASANASERETRRRRETRSRVVVPLARRRKETTTCRRNREAARGNREIERRRSRRCPCRRSCGAWRRRRRRRCVEETR